MSQILHSQSSERLGELASFGEAKQITEYMKQIRKKTLEDRRRFYIEERINDRKVWYATKARWNQFRESIWFATTWILQIVAAIFAIILVSNGNSITNPIGILTTAGAGVLSWMNARRHRELSQSYNLIVQELTGFEVQIDRSLTDEMLEKAVMNVENAISREHTIWLTRRLT